MKHLLLFIALCLATTPAVRAQGIIINKYAAVIDKKIDCDSNLLIVDTATDFNTGDTILLIQMKGAAIDSTNTAAFGSITAYNGAGNYELNEIAGKSGNRLRLKYVIKNSYDIPGGKVQIVRVPYYNNYTVAAVHTCMPWNGSKGGVLVLNVANTLTLLDGIDVSARGFRGGDPLMSGIMHCNRTDYYYPGTNNDGGHKGEGIAGLSAAKIYGRGALANGGGGGNSHNSGGGGGSNGGAGGRGGDQYPLTGLCPVIVPKIGGEPGRPLSYSLGKIFAGGGGGAGHTNEFTDKPGGSGGGIAIIIARDLDGNAKTINANGGNVIECTGPTVGCANDGHSGGGAGGTVALKIGHYSSNVQVAAKGGKGADAWIFPSVLFTTGPGGGGGGGVVWFSQATPPPLVSTSLAGGANGIATQYFDTSWGAAPGMPGLATTSFVLDTPSELFIATSTVIAAFKDTQLSCFSFRFTDLSTVTSSSVTDWYWDFGDGTTATTKDPVHTFPGYGSYPVKLVAKSKTGCTGETTKTIVINRVHFARAGNDTGACLADGKASVRLHAGGGVSYLWSPAAAFTDPAAAAATAWITGPATFIVTVTDSMGCTDQDTVSITIVPGKTVEATPKDTAGCIGSIVQLHASGSLHYKWFPPMGLSNPAIADPQLSITATGDYVVTATDSSGCTSYDTIHITHYPAPRIKAYAEEYEVSCDHHGVQLHASGGLDYVWTPEVYCNDSRIADPIVKPPSTTVFTVTGTNGYGCKGMDTVLVSYTSKPQVRVPNAFTPNKDGLNDILSPIIICDFRLTRFSIYNRWGEQVFITESASTGWDGYYKGMPCDAATYFYYITGKTRSDEEVLIKGDIILIR